MGPEGVLYKLMTKQSVIMERYQNRGVVDVVDMLQIMREIRKNNQYPKVSVIIPTYNRGEILPRAIDSVTYQTYPNVELIVVDDGSDDNTDEIIESYEGIPIEYYKHKNNRGGSAARNTGLEAASGEYVAFLDSDDKWSPLNVECQVNHLRSKSQEYIGTYCDIEQSRSKLNDLKYVMKSIIQTDSKPPLKRGGGEDLIKDILKMRYKGGSSALLLKTESVRKIGGFDESFQRHQDWELLIRLLRLGKLSYIDEKLVRKFDTNYPSADKVADSKKKFLNEFSSELGEMTEKEEVIDDHLLELSKLYFREGRFELGYQYYSQIQIRTVSDILQITWAAIVGVINQIPRDTKI